MFGKILESTKGYLTTDTSELDQVKKRLEEKDDQKTYLQIKPFEKLKEFLESKTRN